MSKIKIHELAKKLNRQSKEVMDVANKLGLDVKSHLNTIDEEMAKKIEKELNNSNKEKTNNVVPKKEKSNSMPVIIRREVIISDEEIAKREKPKETKIEKSRKDVGFVERSRNQEYNIVYRNKPSKPMTASELFGFTAKPKREEPKKEETVITNKDVVQTKLEKEGNKKEIEANSSENRKSNYKSNEEYNENHKFQNNKPRFDNNRQRNFGDNNNRQNNFNKNNRYQNRNNSDYNNNGNRQNNSGGNFRNNNQRRTLDERGIEKNIKNIMAQDLGGKEATREYNRSMTKQKNNRNISDENRQKKSTKSRREEEFDSGKLKNLKQENKLSNMFGDLEGGMLDYYDLTTVRGKKGKKKNNRR